MSCSKRLALENAVQDFFYAESKAVSLGDALDLRFAIARPQNSGELAKAINALVVHLDGHNALELLENFLKAIRQRMQVTQMQRADFFSVFTRHFRRVVDWTVS